MKRHAPVLFLLSALLLACAGTLAREHALLPAMRQTWGHLRQHVEAELQVAPDAHATAQVAAADQAIESGVPAQIAAVDWAVLEDQARRHVDRLEAELRVGPHGAGILRARITEFAAARADYLRTP